MAIYGDIWKDMEVYGWMVKYRVACECTWGREPFSMCVVEVVVVVVAATPVQRPQGGEGWGREHTPSSLQARPSRPRPRKYIHTYPKTRLKCPGIHPVRRQAR